jgi:hypothetical protein
MTGYFYMTSSGIGGVMDHTMPGIASISLIDEKTAQSSSGGQPQKKSPQLTSKMPDFSQAESVPAGKESTTMSEMGTKPKVAMAEPKSSHSQPMAQEEPKVVEAPEIGKQKPATIQPPAVNPVMLCYKSGPFMSNRAAKKMLNALTELGVDAKIKKQIKTKKLGYWVYLKPERSLALSRLKAEEVKTKGISDVAVVVKSKPKYAISLGVFNHKNTAEARKIKAESLGFKPLLTTRYDSETQRWIHMQVRADREPSEAQWKALIKGKKGIEIKPMECRP